MSLDPQRFPRASAYLERLPHGIGSFPDCLVQVDGRLNLARDFADLAEARGIPLPVREFLEGKVTEAWMPEVISVATLSMARDVKFADDEELRDWCYRDALAVFDRPLNKMLMKVMSPTLVVMGAAKRWNNWRLGSTLTAKPVQKKGDRLETEIELAYPDHLYDEVSLLQLGQVFIASVVASSGKAPQLAHEVRSPGVSRYVVSWEK